MKMTRLFAAAIAVAAFGGGAAVAQSVGSQPAEFPPASYKGKQYVDSRGCVFIRAGIDGNVSWVPRVTRARKAVCGFKPTNAGSRAAQAAPTPAPQVEQITIDAPDVTAPAPQSAPRRVATAAPRATVTRPAAPARVVRASDPVIVGTLAQTTRAAAPQAATDCPNASPVSQRYLRGSARAPVRCGPQAAAIVAAPRTADRAVGDHTRIVPRHVAINRLNTTNVTVPKGYKKVWTDGRLNPKRAEQSLSGRGQMLLVWTNTVPRRLINRANGRDVTASVPLVYPYLDVKTQRRDLGEVTIVQRDGQRVKRIVRHGRATSRTRAEPQPVLSSRSAPVPNAAVPAPRAKAKAKGGNGYVQIGLFTTNDKAQRAAQHLSGMGMAARIGKVRYKGKSYLSVQAGPFDGARALSSAMSRLKGVGYTGARVR